MKLLEGKTAIITGGTRGIGFAIAQKFMEHGAHVAICGSRPETVEPAVLELKALAGDAVMGIVPDLGDPQSIAQEFQRVVDAYGGLDILGNNAGKSSRTALVDYTKEEVEDIMDLNVNDVLYCSQAAARIFIEQGEGGCIINTSSMVGRYAQPSGSVYPISKFAVNGLTLSLARELAPHGIRVNAVAPGITHTDMVDALPESIIEPLIASIPLGRMGTPEDIANAYLFLASDMASYISGAVLPVDGLSRP